MAEADILVLIKHCLELEKTTASINLLFRGSTLQVADCVAVHVVIVIHSSFLATVHKSFNTGYLVYKYWISGHGFDALSLKRKILRILRKVLRWRRLYIILLVVVALLEFMLRRLIVAFELWAGSADLGQILNFDALPIFTWHFLTLLIRLIRLIYDKIGRRVHEDTLRSLFAHGYANFTYQRGFKHCFRIVMRLSFLTTISEFHIFAAYDSLVFLRECLLYKLLDFSCVNKVLF